MEAYLCGNPWIQPVSEFYSDRLTVIQLHADARQLTAHDFFRRH
jgi:hypothetical protein